MPRYAPGTTSDADLAQRHLLLEVDGMLAGCGGEISAVRSLHGRPGRNAPATTRLISIKIHDTDTMPGAIRNRCWPSPMLAAEARATS
jgi:hypothetical protein